MGVRGRGHGTSMKLSLSWLCVFVAACNGRIESVGDLHEEPGSETVSSPSSTSLPVGIWSMAVQYGQVGVQVPAGAALQIEVRSDGTVYRWVCDEAPVPEGMTAPCDRDARIECLVTSADWTGSHWRMAIAHPSVYANQGELQVNADGDMLIPYVNPTYSGALFKRVADEDKSSPGCWRY